MAEALGLLLKQLELSSGSKRPKLLESQSEIELCWVQSVDLEFKPHEGGLPTAVAEKYENGNVAVTSHRLLWLHSDDRTQEQHCWLPLASIKGHKGVNSFFKKTPRVYLDVWMDSNTGQVASAAQVESISATNTTSASTLVAGTLTLALRGPSNSYDTFDKNFKLALSRKEWQKTAEKNLTVGEKYERNKESRMVGSSAAGIGGLIRKQQEESARADKSIDLAFKDLSALMDKARDMVTLSQKLKEALEENARKSDNTEKEDKGIEKFLLTLGISSPVTKSTAGSMYHRQLAQQLADFLVVPLKKSHGALALVDIYCIFNRARGIELVSPEDLIEAANLFPSIGIKMQLRKFESGTLAIQSSEHSDDAVYKKLESMTNRNGELVGVGVGDVANGLDVPVILAREYLLMAEGNQVLCRDEGPNGLRFFTNAFL